MAVTQTSKQLSVTLVKSPIGAKPDHRSCVRGLGLRRIRHTVVLENTPAIRGMVNKISHLLNVQEA